MKCVNDAVVGCHETVLGTQRWISCDALFNLDYPTLKTKAQLIFAEKCDQLRADPAAFDFSRDGGLDAFVQSRQAGMDAFFADYESGLLDARYRAINTIALPFPSFAFDVAVSSHYFFAELEN